MKHPTLPYNHRRFVPPVPSAPALEVIGLEAAYPGSHKLAVRDVTFTVPTGKRLALVGPNGAGKSSILKAVAGLLPAQAGTIRIYGNPVGACHHRVAYLPQRGEIDWRFPISVRRLVLTGRYVHLGWLRWPKRHDRNIVKDVLAHMGLSDLADTQIGRLSGGQQQRVLLARALAQEADLLLLDEPFNAVDAATREALTVVLGELRKQGKTVVAATHDLVRLQSEFDAAVYLRAGRRVSTPDGSWGHCGSEKEKP